LAQRKFWMRWRVRTGYPVAVLFLALAAPTARAIAIGAAVAFLGLAIRAYASGYLRKDRELATTGPYARTRNPLYFGSAILAAGFVIAGNSIWAGGLVALYFGVFYYAVMRNEEVRRLMNMPRACRCFSHRSSQSQLRGRVPDFPGRNTRAIANIKRSSAPCWESG
jgi:protein-S-isoprenylcysteine O-methyltransferase Ste14